MSTGSRSCSVVGSAFSGSKSLGRRWRADRPVRRQRARKSRARKPVRKWPVRKWPVRKSPERKSQEHNKSCRPFGLSSSQAGRTWAGTLRVHTSLARTLERTALVHRWLERTSRVRKFSDDR
jgi:hypothetical protein